MIYSKHGLKNPKKFSKTSKKRKKLNTTSTGEITMEEDELPDTKVMVGTGFDKVVLQLAIRSWYKDSTKIKEKNKNMYRCQSLCQNKQ